MTLAPCPDIVGMAEGKHGCTEMMDVIPGCTGWHGEVHPQVALLDATVHDRDVDILAFATDACVDGGLSAGERGDTARAPHAMRPPSAIARLHPCRRVRYGKRMDDPWLADVRVEDQAMVIAESA